MLFIVTPLYIKFNNFGINISPPTTAEIIADINTAAALKSLALIITSFHSGSI